MNHLERKDTYSATSNNIKLIHWPLMGGLLHLVPRGRDWTGPQPAQAPSRCSKCISPPINGQCPDCCRMVRCSAVLMCPLKGYFLLTVVSGSLQIRHSLESDEGKYECVAENSVGVTYSYGANLYVRGTHCSFNALLFNASSMI